MAVSDHRNPGMRGRMLLLLGVAPVVLLVLVGRYLDDRVIQAEQLYRMLESLGAMLSLGTGMFLLRRVSPVSHCPRFWMSCSLLSMAGLGGFHAVLPLGLRFEIVQVATMVLGGLFVLPIVVGRTRLTARLRGVLPLAIGAFCLTVGLGMLLSYRWWPAQTLGETARVWQGPLSGLAGLVFLAAAFRLRYRTLNATGNPESALAAICLLLGLGGLTLEFAPDGTLSWLWQLSRSTAFLLLLVSMERMSRDEHRVLVETMEELEQARISLSNACYGIFWVGSDGVVTDHNRTARELLGYERDQIDGRKFIDHFTRRSGIWFEIWQSILKKGGYEGGAEWRHADGSAFPVRIAAHRVAHAGRFSGCFFVSDHTETDIVEKRLQANISRFRAITENTSDIIFILGNNGTYTYVSPAAARHAGVEERDLLGRRPGQFIIDKDRPKVKAALDQARSRPGETVIVDNVRILRRDGELLYLEGAYTCMPRMPGVEGIVLNYRDVTERRHSERELERNRQRLRSLIANVPGMVYMCSLQGDRLVREYVSEYCESLLGYSRDELEGPEAPRTRELIHEDDYERAVAEMWQAVESDQSFRIQYRIRSRSGDLKWVLEMGRGNRDADGNLESIEGLMIDISDRISALEALSESRRQLATTLGNMPGMAYRCANDEALNLEFVSDGVLQLTGYTAEQVLTQRTVTALDMIHPDDQEMVRDIMQSSLAGDWTYEMEYRIITADGQEKWVWEQGVGLLGENGHCEAFEGFVTDISARIAAERTVRELNQELEQRVVDRTRDLQDAQEQLIASAKMAALGALVAGLAHEINTPLGVGVTAASHLRDQVALLRGRYETGDLKRSDLEKLLDAGEESARLVLANLTRAAELVQSFKQVSVDQSSDQRREFDLGNYLAEILVSLRPHLKRLPHRVEIDCPQGIVVDGHPGALAQIVTNLVQNSILHGFDDEHAGRIVIAARSEEDLVHLEYSDDGRGMPDEVRLRVFDPFFTTRRGSGGSGLGMHVTYNLATQALGGEISCPKTEGGALFRIVFPRVGAALPEPVGA